MRELLSIGIAFCMEVCDTNRRTLEGDAATARAAFSLISGPGFAYGNRFHWLCRHLGANPVGDRAAFFPLSASISSAFPEREQIRGLSGILVREVCEISYSNYSIPNAFEAQVRLIRNSLRLRRSGSLSRSPSAISSYIPFGIGTVPREPLEFTTTNRDSPSSSK